MGLRQQKCEVHRHEATIQIQQEVDTTVFQDFTQNHYKAMVTVQLFGVFTGSVQAQIVVTPRTGDEFSIDIPPSGSLAIQIEDAQALSIRNLTEGLVTGEMKIVKDFCICCP